MKELTCTYTYSKHSEIHGLKYDRGMDYIFRHLEGVKVVLELGAFVQIEAQTPAAIEAIDALCFSINGDMVIYRNATIKNIMDMLEDEARLNE